MKNSLDKKQFGWCESWKSLLAVSNIFSAVIAAIHFFTKLAYIPDSTAHGKLAILMASCHCSVILVLRLYCQNYNMLIKEGKATKSSKFFWIGIITIVAWEMINLLVLIFL